MVNYTADDFSITKYGSFYQSDKIVFRVFAPEHERLFLVAAGNEYEMHKSGYTFEIALGGDLELVRYHYKNEKGLCFADPFAYLSIDNESIVLNRSKFNKDVVLMPEMKDVIIYEANVRDFSSASSYEGIIKSKFLSFTEEGLKKNDYYMVGTDYIKNLGITHIQLMPVFAYDLDHSDYNWGYNPLAYNYVHRDYVLEDDDPYAYINEFRSAVNKLHEKGIRVVLDVVFNHVYNTENFDLEKMLPGHVFRYRQDGSLAQGTLCGSEINTEDPFIREYICEMVFRYMRLFDIDGIRMDLMGIIDKETVMHIYDTMRIYKKDFVVYGEGWNMGDVLAENMRGSINNHHDLPGVGMFNDFYRDTIINYISGNTSIKDDAKRALMGSPDYLGYAQSVNYVECHDGYTMYDHMHLYKSEDESWVNERRCKLAMALVMLSRGTPFFQMGQEFLRSKKGIRNSYNSGDEINKIDWDLRVKNNDICDYFKGLVYIRKQYPVFNSSDVEISFDDYYGCLIYRIGELMIIINPTDDEHIFNNGHNHQVLFDLKGLCNYFESVITISPYSLVICKA